MAGIEKIVANGIQVVSQAIHKSGGIIQSATKPIENGSEKLTGALSGLATNNSTLANKTPTSQQLAIIKPIETDEEYIKIMNKLFNDQRYDNRWKAKTGDIFDLGIAPWGDAFDIHRYINNYITTGKIPEKYILPECHNDTFMDDIVRCFMYSLKKEDEKFGQFKGVVFRHGFFGDKILPEATIDRFYSTSYSPKILFANEHQGCNAILVNNGHKIYKTQEQLGDMMHMESEREVLLNPNEKYRRIEKPNQELIEAVFKAFDKEDKWGPIDKLGFRESILDKLIFWEKVD